MHTHITVSAVVSFEDPHEKHKSANNCPPPPKTMLFLCFSFLCRNIGVEAAAFSPSNPSASCDMARRFDVPIHRRVLVRYSWGDTANLRNREVRTSEKRGMSVQ